MLHKLKRYVLAKLRGVVLCLEGVIMQRSLELLPHVPIILDFETCTFRDH